jgi:DNA polymerase I
MNAIELEMRLMPRIGEMERRGVRLDMDRLSTDTDQYWMKLDELDQRISAMLGRNVDPDSNADLADAIEASGKSKGFRSTATGKRSVAKDSLIEAIDDPELLGTLLVRGALATSLRTFMQPWLVQGLENNGRMYLKWNQFRNYSDTGARTGRLSSSPNLQNIPVEWEALLLSLGRIGYTLDLQMPSIRSYLIPDEGMVFVGSDYKAQEMRLLAHFAGGTLLEAVRARPDDDIHQVAATVAGVSRRVAKTLGFAVLYGAGVGRIAESLGISVQEATSIKARYLAALPDIKKFQTMVTNIGKEGGSIATLAGRRYRKDPAVKMIMGRRVDFSYKLVNYYIQGSAADQTKLAMVRFHEDRPTTDFQLVLSVHDQCVAQVPAHMAQEGGQFLEDTMCGSFAEKLRYKITVDSSIGTNFAEV